MMCADVECTASFSGQDQDFVQVVQLGQQRFS